MKHLFIFESITFNPTSNLAEIEGEKPIVESTGHQESNE